MITFKHFHRENHRTIESFEDGDGINVYTRPLNGQKILFLVVFWSSCEHRTKKTVFKEAIKFKNKNLRDCNRTTGRIRRSEEFLKYLKNIFIVHPEKRFLTYEIKASHKFTSTNDTILHFYVITIDNMET